MVHSFVVLYMLVPCKDSWEVDDQEKWIKSHLKRLIGTIIFEFSGLHSPAATGNEAEALSSLNAAVVLHKKGNKDKARKLFRHAMALCPKHPKILNHFGEFLEASEGQILQVELLTYRCTTSWTCKTRLCMTLCQINDQLKFAIVKATHADLN